MDTSRIHQAVTPLATSRRNTLSIHAFPTPVDDGNTDHADDVIRCRGVVTDISKSRSGKPCRMVVSNLSGQTAFRLVLDSEGGTTGIPRLGDAVEVYGYPQKFGDAVGVAIEIAPIPDSDLTLDLTPQAWCATDAIVSMQLMAAVVATLSPDLGRFLSQVLGRRKVAERVAVAPASVADHHSGPGGLAIHTAAMLSRLTSLSLAEFTDAASREALLAAVILHDLGKVMTSDGGFSNFQVAHELRLLGLIPQDAWEQYRSAQRSQSEFLLYLLDPARRREHCSPVPEVHHLIWADRVGASVETARRMFATTEAWTSTAVCDANGMRRRTHRAVLRRSSASVMAAHTPSKHANPLNGYLPRNTKEIN